MKPGWLPIVVLGWWGAGVAFAVNPPVRTAVEVHRALSAAPAAIADAAAVVVRGRDGHTTELRKGSNGWTCFVASGDPEPLPVCFDANGMAWLRARETGRVPDPDKPGYAYRLQGGSAWSSTDPRAIRLPADKKTYVHIPPCVMILDSRMASLSGLPSGQPVPDTRRPFVLFGKTPFAAVVLPVR